MYIDVCCVSQDYLALHVAITHLKVSTADQQVDLGLLSALEMLQCGVYLVQVAVTASLNGNLQAYYMPESGSEDILLSMCPLRRDCN